MTEPTDEELLRIYSNTEGLSSYDGWLALWRAGYASGQAVLESLFNGEEE